MISNNKKIIHKANVLTKEEVEANRSSAYRYIDVQFNNIFQKKPNAMKRTRALKGIDDLT